MSAPTFDIDKVAKKLGVPVSRWPGNCYALACSMVERKLVKGVAVLVGNIQARDEFVRVVVQKMAYNRTRPFKHGNKSC